MVNARPHILKFGNNTAQPPYQDENGDWIVPEPETTEFSFPCRAEPNGTGQMIASNDGLNIVFSWSIYLNRNVDRIAYGTTVKVYQDDELLATGTVKQFSRGQMNARIWV